MNIKILPFVIGFGYFCSEVDRNGKLYNIHHFLIGFIMLYKISKK